MNASPTTTSPRGVVRHPALSALLVGLWLLLQQSMAWVDVAVALMLGLVVPVLVDGFLGKASPLLRPWRMIRFVARVAWDVVASNFTVAATVLNPWSRPQPAWVRVPLDTRHPSVASLLAIVVTNTPGTLSCVLNDDDWTLLVHALDCADTAALTQQIKQRYERELCILFGEAET
jgi:multicomponent K+:H+ antiporter subunit E